MVLPSKLSDISVPDLRLRAERSVLDSIQNVRNKCKSYSRFYLTPDKVEALEDLGITCNDCAIECHKHPASKTIEEYIIQEEIPHLLSKFKNVDCLWMKHNKFHKLREKTQSINSNFKPFLYNEDTCVKDITRYKDSKFNPFQLTSDTLYIDDSAHFLSPEEIYKFFHCNRNLKQIFCTVILPPELLVDGLKPQFPSLYTFEKIDNRNFSFYLDGNPNSRIIQNFSQLWWLRTKCLVNDNKFTFIEIEKLESFGAHHIFCLRRCKLGTDDNYLNNTSSFNSFNLGPNVLIPENFKTLLKCEKLSTRLVNKKLLKTAYGYTTSVGTAKYHQIASRIRNITLGTNVVTDERQLGRIAKICSIVHELRDKITPDFIIHHRWFHCLTLNPLILGIRRSLNFEQNALVSSFDDLLAAPYYTHTVPLQIIRLFKRDFKVYKRWSNNTQKFLHNKFGVNFNCGYVVRTVNVSSEEYEPLAEKPPQTQNVPDVRSKLKPDFSPEYFENNEDTCGTCAQHGYHEHCVYNNHIFTEESTCPECQKFSGKDKEFENVPNMCLYNAISSACKVSRSFAWGIVEDNNLSAQLKAHFGIYHSNEELNIFASRAKENILLVTQFGEFKMDFSYGTKDQKIIYFSNNHFTSNIDDFAEDHQMQHKDCNICRRVKLRGGNAEDNKSTPDNQKPLFNPRTSEYVANKTNAKRLLADISSGNFGTGLVSKRWEGSKATRELLKDKTKFKVKLSTSFGVPGCGKSISAIKHIKDNLFHPSKATLIFPTNKLRNSVRNQLNCFGDFDLTKTFEFALVEPAGDFVLIDDLGKFPPGYLDLFIATHSYVKHIHVTGDPSQAIFHSINPESSLECKDHEIFKIKNRSSYKTITHRLSQGVAKQLGLKTTSYRVGNIHNIRFLPNSLPILTASHESNSLLPSSDSNYTFASSLGITFENDYVVYIDESALKTDDSLIYTAFTRGKGSVLFVKSPTIDIHDYFSNQLCTSPILRAILNNNDKELSKAVSNHIASTSGLIIGGAALDKAEDEIPSLSGIYPNFEPASFDEDSFEIDSFTTPEIEIASYPTTLPIFSLDKDIGVEIENIINLPREPIEREKLINGVLTEQVDDENFGKQIFLRHRASDGATVAWSTRERICKPDKTKNLKTQSKLGFALFSHFSKLVNLPNIPFNNKEYEDCITADRERYLSKGLKTLASICDRNDPTWHENFIHLFLKSQTVTKLGTIDRNAKKGQMIMCLCTMASARFGPLAEYITRKMQSVLPKNIFFLNGNTPQDLERFSYNNVKYGVNFLEGDFEAYDQSQKEEFLVFDTWLMRALNIPNSIIDDYLKHMTGLYTYLGKLGIMMPTGCKFTLILNSMRTLAYLSLKYRLSAKNVIFVSGDDSVISNNPLLNDIWPDISKHFKLVLKTETKEFPHFCGWKITPEGVLKDPEIVLARIINQIGRNNFKNCVLNYAAESNVLNSNFETMLAFLNEREIDIHFATQEILKNNAKLLNLPISGFSDESKKRRKDRPYNLKNICMYEPHY